MKRTSLFRFIRMYGWKSVFFRYLSSSFLIILLIFVPYNLLIFTYMDYVQEQNLVTQSTTIALKSKEIFDLLTSEFFIDYKLASNNEQIRAFLAQEVPDPDTVRFCQDLIVSMSQDSDIIEEVFLFNPENRKLISSLYGEVPAPADYDWTRTYSAVKLPFLMFPRRVNSDTFNYIYLCGELWSPGLDSLGAFCVKLNYARFSDIVNQSFEEKPDQIFIVSDIGLILYSNTPELINTLMFEHKDMYAAFNSARSAEGNTIIYNDSVISVAKSAASHLLLMSYNDRKHLLTDLSSLSPLLPAAGATILLLSLCLALFISIRHYRSVVAVMDTLKDPDKLKLPKNHMLSEFFYISHTISDISRQNSSISTELDEKIVELKKSQISALQAQINPHFLFNTLQLINFSILSELKRETTATKLLSQLSDLLHYSYDTERYSISVREEIDYTVKYLEIQKVRYKNKLQVLLDIDESCFEFQTLKLILQPLVENCIIHGLKGKETDWQIRLSCRKEKDYILFEIADNGAGIPPEKLSAINASIRQLKQNASDSIGILNIAHRIQLVFGTQCSLRLESVPEEGTSFLLRHRAAGNLQN